MRNRRTETSRLAETCSSPLDGHVTITTVSGSSANLCPELAGDLVIALPIKRYIKISSRARGIWCITLQSESAIIGQFVRSLDRREWSGVLIIRGSKSRRRALGGESPQAFTVFRRRELKYLRRFRVKIKTRTPSARDVSGSTRDRNRVKPSDGARVIRPG